jgi:hypothetical protein
VFPCNRGVSSPVFRLVPRPSYTASLITAVNCYSSGRRDVPWRREIGVDLKGRLCSTARADEAVYEIAALYKIEAPCTRCVPQFGVSGVFSLCGDMQNQ